MEKIDPNTTSRLPAGQQLIAPEKWPVIGEKHEDQPVHDGTISIVGCVQPTTRWDLEALATLPQTSIVTDIHCVTRWSKFDMHFEGVLLAELLEHVQVDADARFVSFVANSARDHSTSLPLREALELNTLIATKVGGALLSPEHGGPLRTIVPGKYFYKSVKWLKRIELLVEDRLGYWEAESGYHNGADPWLEQRYMAPTLNKRDAARLIESRDFSDQDLRSIDAQGRNLDRLKAVDAKLRNANFSLASLVQANFFRATLANADFRRANLQGADFRAADLEGANFCGSDLRGADLTEASLFGATFFDAEKEDSNARLDQHTKLPDNWRETLSPSQQAFIIEALDRSA